MPPPASYDAAGTPPCAPLSWRTGLREVCCRVEALGRGSGRRARPPPDSAHIRCAQWGRTCKVRAPPPALPAHPPCGGSVAAYAQRQREPREHGCKRVITSPDGPARAAPPRGLALVAQRCVAAACVPLGSPWRCLQAFRCGCEAVCAQRERGHRAARARRGNPVPMCRCGLQRGQATCKPLPGWQGSAPARVRGSGRGAGARGRGHPGQTIPHRSGNRTCSWVGGRNPRSLLAPLPLPRPQSVTIF